MVEHGGQVSEQGEAIGDADIHAAAPAASPKPALFDRSELLQKPLWSVPETAWMVGVSPRTVWRELSDPKSKFPRPRRLRGRTLLLAAEVMAFLEEGA